MKNLFLILPLSLLLFVSCDSGSSGSSSSSIASSNVDARLQVYLNEFMAEAGKRGVALNGNRLSRLDIQFGELEQGTLGTCSSSSEKNEITINNDINQSQIRWVVMHELGHCILRIEHRDNVLSVMNSVLRQPQLERLGDDAAFDEFFQEQFFEAF